MKYVIFSDGGSRGNPGLAAAGFLIKAESGEILVKGGSFLGKASNNIAEYQGVVLALRKLKNLGASTGDTVEVFVDSQLVAQQLNGLFKVKNAKIRELILMIRGEETKFKSVSYTHINRDANSEADRIVNEILDRGSNGN